MVRSIFSTDEHGVKEIRPARHSLTVDADTWNMLQKVIVDELVTDDYGRPIVQVSKLIAKCVSDAAHLHMVTDSEKMMMHDYELATIEQLNLFIELRHKIPKDKRGVETAVTLRQAIREGRGQQFIDELSKPAEKLMEPLEMHGFDYGGPAYIPPEKPKFNLEDF